LFVVRGVNVVFGNAHLGESWVWCRFLAGFLNDAGDSSDDPTNMMGTSLCDCCFGIDEIPDDGDSEWCDLLPGLNAEKGDWITRFPNRESSFVMGDEAGPRGGVIIAVAVRHGEHGGGRGAWAPFLLGQESLSRCLKVVLFSNIVPVLFWCKLVIPCI